MMNIPKHKFEVTIRVGGNTERDVERNVDNIMSMTFDGLRSFVSSCGILDVEVNESQTEENYRTELENYLAWKRQNN